MKSSYLKQISARCPDITRVPEAIRNAGDLPRQIRTLRQALGMTQAQLASRAGMKQSQVAQIEKNPQRDLSLSTIRALAEALDCEYVSVIVPRKNLMSMLDERAEALARRLVTDAAASNALELQEPDNQTLEESIRSMKEDLLANHRKALWKTTCRKVPGTKGTG